MSRSRLARPVGQPRPAGLVELRFSRLKRISRARSTTGAGNAGQLGHMDAVALVGGAGDDLAEEDDLVLPFLDRDMGVLDPRHGSGRVRSARGSGWRTASWPGPPRCRAGIRPRPRRCSARRTCWCRGRSRRAGSGSAGVALLRMLAVSIISTMNVDWPTVRKSMAPIRVKIRSTTPISAAAAGTNDPIWARMTIRASGGGRSICRPCSGR